LNPLDKFHFECVHDEENVYIFLCPYNQRHVHVFRHMSTQLNKPSEERNDT